MLHIICVHIHVFDLFVCTYHYTNKYTFFGQISTLARQLRCFQLLTNRKCTFQSSQILTIDIFIQKRGMIELISNENIRIFRNTQPICRMGTFIAVTNSDSCDVTYSKEIIRTKLYTISVIPRRRKLFNQCCLRCFLHILFCSIQLSMRVNHVE